MVHIKRWVILLAKRVHQPKESISTTLSYSTTSETKSANSVNIKDLQLMAFIRYTHSYSTCIWRKFQTNNPLIIPFKHFDGPLGTNLLDNPLIISLKHLDEPLDTNLRIFSHPFRMRDPSRCIRVRLWYGIQLSRLKLKT